MRARSLAKTLFAVAFGSAAGAQAAPPGGGGDSNAVSYAPQPSVRRDGFAMGLTSSFGLSQLQGYRNTVEDITDPAKRQTTGGELGSNFSMWFGGAIRDWLSVGIGLTSTATLTGNPMGANPALLLHIEGFPLFARGATWQDLGIAFEGGVGTSVILDRNQSSGSEPLADGGSMSSLGVSVFYEPLRFWHFSAGPSLSYLRAFSQSMTADHLLLGFRVSLYGVVPDKDKESRQTAGHAQTARY